MFLIRPPAFPEESLSSWRQRAGTANGFLRFPRPTGVRNTKDPDRFPATDELLWLQDEFRLERDFFWERCAERIGVVVSSGFDKAIKPPWLIPLAASNSKRYGPSFCAECLCNDVQPHYRLAWRFAFVVACPLHGRLLLDRCPTCEHPAWPSWLRTVSDWRSVNLQRCPGCGEGLCRPTQESLDNSPSTELWACTVNQVVPPSTPQCSSTAELFGGLRVLCQLLLRSSGNPLYSRIPQLLATTQSGLLSEASGGAIEVMPIQVRVPVIAAAFWLLQDWPRRFLDIARSSGLSKQNFASLQIAHPVWMADAIHTRLTRRTTGITRHQVEQAIADIKVTGHQVSKSAVRRRLRVTEAAAINDLLSQRRIGTERELAIVCGACERLLASVSTSRDQRAAFLRDYLIFLLSVLSGRPLENVCGWQADEVRSFIQGAKSLIRKSTGLGPALAARASELNHLYADSTRPHFVRHSRSEQSWFVARQGRQVEAHSVRSRVSTVMAATLPPHLWRSADVFLRTIAAPERPLD